MLECSIAYSLVRSTPDVAGLQGMHAALEQSDAGRLGRFFIFIWRRAHARQVDNIPTIVCYALYKMRPFSYAVGLTVNLNCKVKNELARDITN
jgi:hypothetical protein